MIQEKIQTVAVGTALWGSVAVSILEAIQPAVTVIAMIAATIWSVVQIYYKVKHELRKAKETNK